MSHSTHFLQSTSLDAFTNLKKGKLGQMQQLVYDTIKKLGCPTDLELARYLGYSDPNHIRPRRNDLVRMGLVVQHERRICSVSGRACYSWRITP